MSETAETLETSAAGLTDRELLIRLLKMVEHVDIQVHEHGITLAGLAELVEESRPLLDRARKLAINPVGTYLAGRRGKGDTNGR